MSSTIGKHITVSVFGESHGPAIGMVMDNPPAGLKIDFDMLLKEIDRRAPGNDPTATKRKEADIPTFLSGIKEGVTTGAPICAVINNTSQHSNDYSELKKKPRPSHADYAANVHYKGFNDICGGGHFSGRLTAPIVVAGAILKQYLKQKGITVGGHIFNIGSVYDTAFDRVNVNGGLLDSLSAKKFSVIDDLKEEEMRREVESFRIKGDSVGGSVEIAVTGIKAGFGSPMFMGAENIITSAVFGIPAVKGIEFGAGFDFANMCGSEANDQMYFENGEVRCYTNNNGGITGGITNGMPIIFKVALKPTPSIAAEQKTVDLYEKGNTTLKIKGRHDPCIVPRALPAVEAVTAIAIANLLKEF